MTTALQSSPRRSTSRLQDASLLNGPMLLLRSIRGFRRSKSLVWLATVPLAFLGLGTFNFAASAEVGEVSLSTLTGEQAASFLADNLWLFVATILVIFMNAGFAMVEAGMCRQKNAVNILAKNLFVFALAVTAYWFIGYSLMYGNTEKPIIDGFLYFKGLFVQADPSEALACAAASAGDKFISNNS